MGEILRQREAIATWFAAEGVHLRRTLSPKRATRELKRRHNILNYLEVTFSEVQLRSFLALYLWGRGWRDDYDACPTDLQSQAENAPYEEVICTLVGNWTAFKQASELNETTIQTETSHEHD